MVKEANIWLDEAQSFMRSIDALEVHLTTARADAPGEITAAQTDITKAWQYINNYDEDIRESLEDDLHGAERTLNQARNELAKDVPDYLHVLQLAREVNATADRILAEAHEEHEAAERLRARAASELRDARAAVSRAKEYLEDHSREAGRAAQNYLRDAQAHLRDAEAASDLNTRISHAQQAETEANRAYSTARNAVDAAPIPRRPIYIPVPLPVPTASRPRQNWGSPSSRPSSQPNSPSRVSGGGGGSTKWSPSGRGGGGSTRW
jgi:ElaB/YqjD/DUF883 family membrane-anchored ribosome-binding protein